MKPDERDPVAERILGGLQPAEPPPRLRSRVLNAAREHVAVGVESDLWSRIWAHRGLRLAWAVSAVLLLAGHVLVRAENGSAVAPDLVTENRVDEYLVEMLRPVQISDDAQPFIGYFASAGDPMDIDMKGNAS